MNDARWQALQDALAVDEPPPESGELDVRAEPQWRDELDFYDALAQSIAQSTEAPSAPSPTDEAIIAAALEGVPVERVEQDAPPRRAALYGGMAAVLTLAAAAVLWFAWPDAVVLRGDDGAWGTEAGDTVASGQPLPVETWLQVGDAASEACMVHGTARLCADPGSRLRVRDADARRLELAAGAVAVTAGAWTVELAGQQHELQSGQRLAVESTRLASNQVETAPTPDQPPEEEPEQVETPRPKVETAPEKSRRRGSVPPRLDAGTLVARARKARGEGRLADADRDYSELLRRFPKSAEARVGRVALGQVKLRRGKAKAALRLFDKASKSGGPLAEEAAWGKLQALDRLGRKDALRSAVRAFEAKYPTSVYRARAQGLL